MSLRSFLGFETKQTNGTTSKPTASRNVAHLSAVPSKSATDDEADQLVTGVENLLADVRGQQEIAATEKATAEHALSECEDAYRRATSRFDLEPDSSTASAVTNAELALARAHRIVAGARSKSKEAEEAVRTAEKALEKRKTEREIARLERVASRAAIHKASAASCTRLLAAAREMIAASNDLAEVHRAATEAAKAATKLGSYIRPESERQVLVPALRSLAAEGIAHRDLFFELRNFSGDSNSIRAFVIDILTSRYLATDIEHARALVERLADPQYAASIAEREGAELAALRAAKDAELAALRADEDAAEEKRASEARRRTRPTQFDEYMKYARYVGDQLMWNEFASAAEARMKAGVNADDEDAL